MNMKIRTAAGGGLASKKLLAAIAVLAVAFAVFAAIPAVADGSDAATGTTYYVGGTDASDDNNDGKSAEKPFKTIDKALKATDVSKIVLNGNVTEFITIADKQSVTLDLNGKTLTNDSDERENGVKGVIVNNGTLTIMDSGKTGNVNATNGMVAIANVGTLTIESGKFTNNVNADSYANYILNNNGTVTINGGEFAMDLKNTTNSSIVKNGWADPDCKDSEGQSAIDGNDVVQWTDGKKAVMTINNGSFSSWTYVKNDTYGQMTINNGTFTTCDKTDKSTSVNSVFNGGDLTVKGGTFDNTKATKVNSVFYVSAGSTTTIDGGIYKLADNYRGQEGASPLISITGEETKADGMTITVSSEAVKAINGHPAVKSAISTWTEDKETKYGKVMGALDLDVAGNSISISDLGTLSEQYLPTFTYTDGKLVIDQITVGAGNSYVSGNVKIESLTVGNDSTVVLGSGSEAILAESSKDKNAQIVSIGGVLKDQNGNTIEAEGTTVFVKDIDELLDALEKSNSVTVAHDIDASAYEGVITVRSGTTLYGNGLSINLGADSSLQVDGTIAGVLGIKFGQINNETNKTNLIRIGNNEQLSGSFSVKTTTNGAEISADKIQGAFTYTGTLKFSGKVSEDLAIDGTGAIVFGNTTVNSGVTLTLPAVNAKVDGASKAVFNLYGTIDGGKSIDVEENASFKAYSGAQLRLSVTGKGNIDLSQAQNPQSVGEDISADKTYGQLENVTIVDSLTIKNKSTVTVKGGFNVNEGVTLTIEKDSKLIINSASASMIVAGKIIIEEGATLKVEGAKDVQVSGSIESEGTVSITSTVTVKSGGSIVINDATVKDGNYASTFTAGADLTVEAGAELIIKSKVASVTTVTNKGTVTLDGAVLGEEFNVNMAADKAVVQVLSVSGNHDVNITDAGLKFAKDKYVTKANTVTIAVGSNVVKGLTVVETVSSMTYNGTTTYYNTLDLAGTVSVASATSTELSTTQAVFSVSGDRIAVTGELTLGKNVTLTVNEKAKLSVSGKIIATEDGSKIANSGEITVTGLIQVIGSSTTKIADVINAAMYETKSGTDTIYNYTTLKAAVDAAAKDITVTGEISVDESFTVPKDTTVKNNGTIVVGSDRNTDVELTFADGAVLKNGTVEVKGTLYFENKKDNKASDIQSDVSVIGEKDARYTNLFTALNNAKAGDTVTVDRELVELKKSITIKEGVTLDVPNSKTLKVFAGVTITVNGTLKVAEKIETGTYDNETEKDLPVQFALAADKLTGKAAIVVSGVFMSGVQFSYNGETKDVPVYMIPGAYYHLTDSVGDYYYATTLETASKSAATAVDVYGKVTAGDVAFAGTDSSKKTVTVKADADLTAASITLDKATFVVETGRFTGDVKAGESAVTVKNVKGMTVSVVDDVYTIDGAESAADSTKGEKPSFTVSAGSVYISEAKMNVKVASGATLVSGNGTEIDGKLTIEGTVAVANDQIITVDGDVVVKGTLTVAAATDSKGAGTFNANNYLYIGITSTDITGDAASVTGAVNGVDVAFVKADATVSEATIDSFKVNGVLKSTTYIVEDKDWMTVYDMTGGYYITNVTEAPVENAEFNYWMNTDGDRVTTEKVGANKCDKVTADVEYEIYTIYINVDAGLESIAIDGNLMSKNAFSGVYTMDVKAGTHEITCKLANGYSGDAKFSLVKSVASDDGKIDASVSGNKVTVSGDRGAVYVQITGITSSGYVQPTEPTEPAQDDNDGLSLTDILLIILVVLIVVMAIIVALRLMRS